MANFLDNVIQTADDVWEILATLKNQYAFPLAFIRELIQNALDAGTRKVEVVLEERSNTEKQSYLIYRVRDYGCGMDLNDIKQNYFCLFNSTKEGDRTTAGQFGVGVSSCWAVDPEYFFLTTGKDGAAYKFGWQRGMKQFKGKVLPEAWIGTEVEVWSLFKSKLSKKHDKHIEGEVEKAKKVVSDYFKYNPVPILFKAVLAGNGPIETVDFEKLNQPFDLDEPIKLHLNTEHQDSIDLDANVEIQAVISLSEKPWTRYEVKNIMIEEEFSSPIGDNLKLIVNSPDFRYPIARNAIQKDANFHLIFKTIDSVTPKLYSRFFNALNTALKKIEKLEEDKALLSWGFEILQALAQRAKFSKAYYNTLIWGNFGLLKNVFSPRWKRDFHKKLEQFNNITKGIGGEVPLFPLINGSLLSLEDIAGKTDIDILYYSGSKNDNMAELLHKEGISLLHLPELHILKKIYKFLNAFLNIGWVEDKFRVVEHSEANIFPPSVIESHNNIKDQLKEISDLTRMGIENCILGKLSIYDRPDNDNFFGFLHKSEKIAALIPPQTSFIERFLNLPMYTIVINVKHDRFEQKIKQFAKIVQKTLDEVKKRAVLTRNSYKELPLWKLFTANNKIEND